MLNRNLLDEKRELMALPAWLSQNLSVEEIILSESYFL